MGYITGFAVGHNGSGGHTHDLGPGFLAAVGLGAIAGPTPAAFGRGAVAGFAAGVATQMEEIDNGTRYPNGTIVGGYSGGGESSGASFGGGGSFVFAGGSSYGGGSSGGIGGCAPTPTGVGCIKFT